MQGGDGVGVNVTCDDCSEKFFVGLAGVHLEDIVAVCPACGREDRFTEGQIKSLVASHQISAEMVKDILKG